MATIDERKEEIESIQLTPEQERYAIWQAKYVEWSRRRNAQYWEELEKQKGHESENMVSYKADAQAVQAGPHVVEKRSPKGRDKAYKAPQTRG